MHHTTTEFVVIVLATVCGLFFGITGLRRRGADLVESLRPYDLKLVIVQLGAGVIGALYLIYLLLFA